MGMCDYYYKCNSKLKNTMCCNEVNTIPMCSVRLKFQKEENLRVTPYKALYPQGADQV